MTDTPMTPYRLAEIRFLDAAASSAPWQLDTNQRRKGADALVDAEGWLVAENIRHPDAAFIIGTRSVVPELLAEVDRLRKALSDPAD
ncbi:hypothetical protein OG923_34175 (plasmid) [Streptomyces halstedii]|uniref:hypothetical protein n=1 Tax=Streptomyces halstedii TaxID=1944 RepID=UPI002F91623C